MKKEEKNLEFSQESFYLEVMIESSFSCEAMTEGYFIRD